MSTKFGEKLSLLLFIKSLIFLSIGNTSGGYMSKQPKCVFWDLLGREDDAVIIYYMVTTGLVGSRAADQSKNSLTIRVSVVLSDSRLYTRPL